MADIRLIATDLDGTLLKPDKRLGEYTRRTLADCIRRGITVMLVSGRCHEEARIPAVEAGLPLMVASSNGARIDSTAYGPTIYERLMTGEECERAYAVLRGCPGTVNSYVRGVNYVRRDAKHFHPGDTLRSGLPDQSVTWVYDDVSLMETEGQRNVHKFEIYDDDPQLLGDYAVRLRAVGLDVTSSNPRDIEIQPLDSSKGAAVRFMADRLGLRKDQIMCFGDNTNDASMLREAGYGVAMGNGVPELRAIADLIAPPNTFEGEARVIRRIAFGEKDIWPAIAEK